jgi:hypothetical protein
MAELNLREEIILAYETTCRQVAFAKNITAEDFKRKLASQIVALIQKRIDGCELTDEEIDKVTWRLAEAQAAQENAYRQSGRNPLAKPKRFTELDRIRALLQAYRDKIKKEALDG